MFDVLFEKLNRFKATKWLRNTYVSDEQMQVYVRESVRLHPLTKERINCFDIANVVVFKPSSGIFTLFIDGVEKWSTEPLFIESIQSERFARFFYERGYLLTSNGKRILPEEFKYGCDAWKM